MKELKKTTLAADPGKHVFHGLTPDVIITPVSYTHLTLPTNREV